ncbi:MAG: winged helix-turn-helix domain-containing protein [Oscillospiraceae bacterium]|nr:winged helix-turn-helix domain-containing protein [Oscillospiraceae bacterium]
MFEIRTFGTFSVKYNGTDVTAQLMRSKRLLNLLAYLVANRRRSLTKEAIIEVLWGDREIDNPDNTLKMVLFRTREALELCGVPDARRVIMFRGGAYTFDPDETVESDYELFDGKLAEAAVAQRGDKIRLLLEAIDCYKGEFLPTNALEIWVMPVSARYRSRYVEAVCEAADLLSEDKRFEEAVEICRRAIALEQFEEALHYRYLASMLERGMRRQALEHYSYLSGLFYSKLGVSPSAELTALYRSIARSSYEVADSIDDVINEMKESGLASGGFYCDLEAFRNIYQLEARTAARTGQVVYVCLLTLRRDVSKDEPSKLNVQMDDTMERLRSVIKTSLRVGDLFTRYSPMQYLALLPATTYETGEMVLQRILKNYRSSAKTNFANLVYMLRPVIPNVLDLGGADLEPLTPTFKSAVN